MKPGTVPATWTNRWETDTHTLPLRAPGDSCIAVPPGPEAEIAKNAAIGVGLRVAVVGDQPAGQQHKAPVPHRNVDGGKDGSPVRADSGGTDAAGWSGPAIAAGAGGTALLAVAAVLTPVRRGGGHGAAGTTDAAGTTTRGGA